MEKGLRLLSPFQSLEKILALKNTNSEEVIVQCRASTSKILGMLGEQGQKSEKSSCKITITKNEQHLSLLLKTLEVLSDKPTKMNVLSILLDLTNKPKAGKRITALVSQGAVLTLLQLAVTEYKDEDCSHEIMVAIYQLLARLGPKDNKFCTKARLVQALSVTQGLARSQSSNARNLLPVLQVLKMLTVNAVNATSLGKSGAMSSLFKVMSACGRKHPQHMRLAADTLNQLVKSRSNSARLIGQGGVPFILTCFTDWQRSDPRNRYVALRKSLLLVLRNVANLKAGRQALLDAGGVQVLYSACQEMSDSTTATETLVVIASTILHRCFPKTRLPVASIRCPLTYPLPTSCFHSQEGGEIAEGEEYESSVDNDDDVSSDDEASGGQGHSSKQPAAPQPSSSSLDGLSLSTNGFVNPLPAGWRSEEDLKQYEQFCQELFVVPGTGECIVSDGVDPCSPFITQLRNTSVHGDKLEPSSSCPRLNCLSSSKIGLPLPPIAQYDSSNGLLSATSTGGLRSSASAINLKTGAALFSLEPITGFTELRAANASQKTSGGGPLQVRAASLNSKKQQNGTTRSSPSPALKRNAASEREMAAVKQLENELRAASGAAGTFGLTGATISSAALDACNTDNNADGIWFNAESRVNRPLTVQQLAAKTISLGRFNKVAYPDIKGHDVPLREPLNEQKVGIQRAKILSDIERLISTEPLINRVVYDLDTIVAQAGKTFVGKYSSLSNDDENRLRRDCGIGECLKFNGQFESGNLRKAIQIRRHEYDLILNPDVSCNHHHQWFYFEVSNMEAGVPYRFNIINCEKANSQFNFGMQPVMYSVAEAVQGRPQWKREGIDVCYYKNHFSRSAQTAGGAQGKTYFTMTFTVVFQHERDICYFAYHYPYTYTLLQYHLTCWEASVDRQTIYWQKQTLCESLMGNAVPLITVTSQPVDNSPEAAEQFRNRPYIFLSSRVHPGESNASWVMKGTLDFLISNRPAAQKLRELFIFKIVPMLNPDGVINGNHRCSLIAEDLNRRWLQPCSRHHPTIFHTKGLMQYLCLMGKTPLVFCDYHGHSRRKDIFLYGCSPLLSWKGEDMDNPAALGGKAEDSTYKILPRLLHSLAPAFNVQNCVYTVEKDRESTARVVVWRQMRVVCSYTMESTYCGCDQGPYKGTQINTCQLEEMGRKFCEGLLKLRSVMIARKMSPSHAGSASASGLDVRLLSEALDRNNDVLCATPSGLQLLTSDLGDLLRSNGEAVASGRLLAAKPAATSSSDEDDDDEAENDDDFVSDEDTVATL